MREEFYLPAPDAVKPQSTTNRQGRAEEPFPTEQAAAVILTLTATRSSSRFTRKFTRTKTL